MARMVISTCSSSANDIGDEKGGGEWVGGWGLNKCGAGLLEMGAQKRGYR